MDTAIFDPIVLIGLILFVGFWIAKGVKLFKFPLVVGYVIAGLYLGSITQLLGPHIFPGLDTINLIALSLIGFGIGAQLELKTLKKFGRSIIWITILQALGAFILVTVGCFLFTHNLGISLIFGALSTATAPAATSEVLREYKAKGPLTTTLYAVVGLDDAVSLIVFGLIMPIATNMMMGTKDFHIVEALLHPLKEIFLSILIGGLGGYMMILVHRYGKALEEMLILSVGLILSFGGIASHFELSLILTAMTMGVVAVNFSRIKTNSILNSMKGFAPPIYVIFFVTAGARLNISTLPTIGILGVIYIATRAFGKYIGSYLGAVYTKSSKKIRNYLGFGLLDQAGVAIGLAVAINHKLSEMGAEMAKMGEDIVNIVTAAVFVTMILAPIAIRHAVIKSGEGHA